MAKRTVEVPGMSEVSVHGPAELDLECAASAVAQALRPSLADRNGREFWVASAVASHLGMTKDTVHRMCESGELEGAFRRGPGGHWRIPREAVDKFFASTRPVRGRAR